MPITIDTNASIFVDVIRKDGTAVGSIKRGHDARTETSPDLYFAGIGEDATPVARVWPRGKAPAVNPTPSIPYTNAREAKLIAANA